MKQQRRRNVLILASETLLTLMGIILNRVGTGASLGGAILGLLLGVIILIILLWRYQTKPFRALSFLLLLFCLSEIGSGF